MWMNKPTHRSYSSPHVAERLLLVSPQIWVTVGFLLSHFGHDRAKNDSGVELLSLSHVLANCRSNFALGCVSLNPRAVIVLCFIVCAQWLVFRLFGSGMEPEHVG